MAGAAAVLLLLKASLLLGAALAAGRALRRAPALRRHRLWSAALGAVVALPLLALALPAVRVRVPAWRAPASPIAAPPTGRIDISTPVATAGARGPAPSPAAPHPANAGRGAAMAAAPSPRAAVVAVVAIVAVWLAGAGASLAALLVALARVAALGASGRELDDPAWREACDRIAARLGVARRVRVLASREVMSPMAGGIVRPTVYVPASAPQWADGLRDVVLAHEIAHLASRDPLRHVVARLALTLYWFHPLAWLAARRAAAACELACDEAVLALGVRPSTYADALLHFADAAAPPRTHAALPIVRRSSLEARLVAILTPPECSATRRDIRGMRSTRVPAVAAVVLTLGLAAVQPSASTAAVAPAAAVAAAVLAPRAVVALEGAAGGEAPAADALAGVAAPRAAASTRGSAPSASQAVEQPATSPCWWERPAGRSFSGSMSMSEREGRTVIHERVGRVGDDRVVQRSFGDLRVCAVGEDLRDDADDPPSRWPSRASRVVLETRRDGDVRRMEIAGGRARWSVDGDARPVDAAAEAWRDRLLALLDATWDLSRLRGRVSSLRGEISSTYGQRSSLEGEISSLRGEVSSMRGRISSLRGEESSLRGEISSIRGHVSSLEGQISSERGAISSLTASRWDRGPSEDDRIRRRVREHEAAIRRLEGEIERYDADARVREVERRIAALDTDGRVRAIEREIRDFDLEGRVAAVNRRITELGVARRVSRIEAEIASLDADRRGREHEARIDGALDGLRAVLRRR
jgi:beta-lactamase regulating signal transducer with metallopeptidase domain/predicted  nucleic acid-binding Zn-ribbon protein